MLLRPRFFFRNAAVFVMFMETSVINTRRHQVGIA